MVANSSCNVCFFKVKLLSTGRGQINVGAIVGWTESNVVPIDDVFAAVSQSIPPRALQVNQSKLSKLTTRLIKQRWLEVRPQPGDRRFLFVRMSPRA